MNENDMKVFILGAIDDEEHLGENLKKQCKEFVENLIVKNKELEEDNRIFALEGSKTKLEIHIKKNYIPKTKAKEKIEKLKKHNYKGNLDDIDFIYEIISEFEEILDEF